MRSAARVLGSLLFVLATACAAAPDVDETPDGEDETFGAGKADGLCAAAGTPAAIGMLELVNDVEVDVDELDASVTQGGAGLNRNAAQNIVDARPIADLAALDAVPWVGVATCEALATYACNEQRRCLAPVDAMTWNLRHFPLTSATEDAVVDILDELGPDLVGVQEVESASTFYDVVDALDGYDGILGHDADTRVGLAYRTDTFEVVGVEHLFDSDSYAFPRPVLAVTMRLRAALEPTEVVFVVVHLKAMSGASNEARRRSAVEKLRAWIDGRRADGDSHVVVLGDWNDSIDEPEEYNVFGALLDGAAHVEVLTTSLAAAGEYSYVPFQKLIDHVVVTDETLDVLVHRSTEVLPLETTWSGEYLDDVSDHRPVRTRFGLPIAY
jgi:endonuclease/exonuclease/phosphatase family metal-dependent hydrolase